MPRKKSTPKPTEEPLPPPTRAAFLGDNPYRELTLEVAETLLATKTTAYKALEEDIRALDRVLMSYSMFYLDKDGKVQRCQ